MAEAGPKETASSLFRESQLFRVWMFWVPVAIVTVVVWWQFYEQIVRNNPQGTQPLPDWAAWVLAIVFGIGFPVFGYFVRLVTEVHSSDVHVRIFPFAGSRITLEDVKEAEVREYAAQREFGGWGVRNGQSGKAYTAYGNRGVQLWLKDGSRTLIGSQRPQELAAALKSAGVFVR
jgi:hypothetical protein